ncbi:sodium:proton antiporter [Candidatus Bealeia paramacronuclearis]|uniref:sodium:proton antiporter n=1 Tax=Candidatus Bealeia paramacronuclearis TaxID=1921001 RepID=UPI002F262FA0
MEGAHLGVLWALPFGGLLLSLALMPLLLNHIWHHHYGKIAFGWSLGVIVPLLILLGWGETLTLILEVIFHEYLPFIILVGALYIISGGILVDIRGQVSASANTFLLGIGTILAGWIGTTGASMLMIRPLLKLNKDRQNKTHLMIFLIFLVANIGGSLTPLGDPPLFLGFLQGVDFFWTLKFLAPETFFISAALLILFYIYDQKLLYQEGVLKTSGKLSFQIEGWSNFMALLGVIFFVLLSGIWDPQITLKFSGVELEFQNISRDLGLLILGLLSYFRTPHKIHHHNEFSWGPLQEIAKLFWGIFITVMPVIAILKAGQEGAFSPLIQMTENGGAPSSTVYFWLTGWLSAFLDNAPTYLVFLNMAGGDVSFLMTEGHLILEALSLGAVFMGAMSYIGNAPNFMVKSIAEENGIPMPTFFGYMKWSCGILLPLFLILTFFHF